MNDIVPFLLYSQFIFDLEFARTILNLCYNKSGIMTSCELKLEYVRRNLALLDNELVYGGTMNGQQKDCDHLPGHGISQR